MSENTAEGTPLKAKIIKLEAPPFLSKGQNLYDQQPFSSIVEDVVAINKTPIENVRRMVGELAELKRDMEEEGRRNGEISLRGTVDLRKFLHGVSHEIPYRAKNKTFFFVYTTLAKKLWDYPHWDDYIKHIMQSARYGADGKYMINCFPKKTEETLSYANWVTCQMQIENKLTSAGIEEIFPEDMHYSDEIASGKRTENRKWRILKATDLTRRH
jgi:hypothetical protein